MSRITKLYKPEDLDEVLSIMQNNLDVSLEPFQRCSRIIKALHDRGWKVVRYEHEKS